MEKGTAFEELLGFVTSEEKILTHSFNMSLSAHCVHMLQMNTDQMYINRYLNMNFILVITEI